MKLLTRGMLALAVPMIFLAVPAYAQDSAVYTQCPDSTDLHPTGDGIKCKHLSGGDGMVTMADGKELYVFSFADIPMPGAEIPGTDGQTAPAAVSGQYAGFVMNYGLMNANAPAPTIIVDEDDELFLTLTNVGMAMRPDLFDPHTVHWHGFPQAASIFDGVPDSSISINMGASLTYYYNAKDAGTYMYHCHVEATEHMQMGMLGNLFVRPRQNRCPIAAGAPGAGLPGSTCPGGHVAGDLYAYNDGDGSTAYDVEKVIQIGSFDPAFHDASIGVQPLPFAGMNDRYYLLNGRGYPDTVVEGALAATPDGIGGEHFSQPVDSLVVAAPGERILLRISNLNVTRYYTLGTNGLTMKVIALDARLLRDDDGKNRYYDTNSLTIGGGQSADVIIQAPATPGTYFLYTQNLDRLSNDEENFGGMMTEIRVQ
jgi:FtsP/CotA-like multicopper oxidase with cupredoxin domain